MKKAITIIASEETYTNLTSFKKIEQLNETVRRYKDLISEMNLRCDVKRNLIAMLEYLKRYSCRFLGVSWRGKRKIAADLGLTDKTVTRICKRLEELGFIRQYEMKRSSDMLQTSNAIVIQPTEVKPQKDKNVRQETAEMSDQENNISLKQIHNNNTKVRTANKPAWIPKEFYKLLAAHFSDITEIEDYWRSVHATTYTRNLSLDHKSELGVKAFMTMKSVRRNLRRPVAYFTGIVKRLVADIIDFDELKIAMNNAKSRKLYAAETITSKEEMDAIGVY